MSKYTFILGFLLIAGQIRAQVWQPDLGTGHYRNPIIYADYSDPDVVRNGDDFYMVSSSFNCAPGLPVLHSKDLVNWKIVNYVFQKQIPEETFNKPQHGNGVWAPSIRFPDGFYYIYYGDPDFGIYMVKTKDPEGQWEKQHLL
ncbi:MAG: glycoside hydrolase, partial [Bacteroidetes bacterium]